MDFSLGTRALSLLQFTVYANESLSILCRPLWLEIRMAQGRRRAVRVRSTPSGQNAFWSGSPHFTYIWYLYLVFFSTFFTFFPVSLLFWAQQKGNTCHTWHKLCPKYTLYRPIDTVPSCASSCRLNSPTSTPSSVPL